MTRYKAKPTPLPQHLRRGTVTGAATLLLASLTACSQAQTNAPGEERAATASDALMSDHPFGDKTPAQRRAAWMKREWTRPPTQSLAQNAGTDKQTARD